MAAIASAFPNPVQRIGCMQRTGSQCGAARLIHTYIIIRGWFCVYMCVWVCELAMPQLPPLACLVRALRQAKRMPTRQCSPDTSTGHHFAYYTAKVHVHFVHYTVPATQPGRLSQQGRRSPLVGCFWTGIHVWWHQQRLHQPAAAGQRWCFSCTRLWSFATKPALLLAEPAPAAAGLGHGFSSSVL